MKLDLASESSIRSFAAEFQSQYPRLDVLVCNAGQLFGPVPAEVPRAPQPTCREMCGGVL